MSKTGSSIMYLTKGFILSARSEHASVECNLTSLKGALQQEHIPFPMTSHMVLSLSQRSGEEAKERLFMSWMGEGCRDLVLGLSSGGF